MAWERARRGRPKIGICVCHTGTATMEWFETTYGPLRFRPVPWFEKVPLLCRGAPIPVCRNKLVEDALRAGCTHIFFLDSDHVVESPRDPNQALRMLHLADAPIVTGLYRAKKRVGYPYNLWVRAEGLEGYVPVEGWTKGSNWFTVDVAGIGNCLIKREVFLKVPRPWFLWDEESPSEDFYFFEKAADQGYKVHVLADVRFSHVGTLKVLSTGEIKMLEV